MRSELTYWTKVMPVWRRNEREKALTLCRLSLASSVSLRSRVKLRSMCWSTRFMVADR